MVKLFHSLPYPVVIHNQRFEALKKWESIKLPDFIIGEVYGVKLVQGGAKIFQDWYFVPYAFIVEGKGQV